MGAAVVALTGDALAFKTKTHVAAANHVSAQLATAISVGGSTDQLEFSVNGHPIAFAVTAKEGYRAVLNHPEFFRAGVIGPDGFPDLLTGQAIMHTNLAPPLQGVLVDIRGGTRPAAGVPNAAFPLELRSGIGQYRAIDFAMTMLQHWQAWRLGVSAVEAEQALAFILGYFSHGVGDGFAHTWVNELAEGAWDIGVGGGIYGAITEEVKHLAVEALVDERVPDALVSDPAAPGLQDRLALRVPHAFLDHYFSSMTTPAPPLGFGNKSGQPDAFFRFYANLDHYNGGPIYNLFNLQAELPTAVRNWSKLGPFFDVADAIDNPATNAIAWLLDFPEDAVGAITDLIPAGIDPDDFITGTLHDAGFPIANIDCPDNSWESLDISGDWQEILRYLGGFNVRFENLRDKAVVARHNWQLLQQCTSENLAKEGAPDFNPADPTRNRDACADLVRAGWIDQTGSGLFRGDVRPEHGDGSEWEENREFLADLRAAFLGADADDVFNGIGSPWRGDAPFVAAPTLEARGDHRRIVPNVERLFRYLTSVGITADDLPEILFPDYTDDASSGGIRGLYDKVCGTARDPAFANCINLLLAQPACDVSLIACEGERTLNCVREQCASVCPFACDTLCAGGTESACSRKCDDLFCVDVFGVPVCEPGTWLTCEGFCTAFSLFDDDSSCSVPAIAECAAEHVDCTIDNIRVLFGGTPDEQTVGDRILSPVRNACDQIDEAIEFVNCLRGDPALPPDARFDAQITCAEQLCEQGRRLDGASEAEARAQCAALGNGVRTFRTTIDRLRTTVTAVASAVDGRPASTFVNIAFIEEDMRRDPGYGTSLRNAVAARRTTELARPTPDPLVLDRLARIDAVLVAIQAGTVPPPLFRATPADDMARTLELIGEVSQTIVGPTAVQILDTIGPDFVESFTPFFNTAQGMKLVPLSEPTDIESPFTAEDVSVDRLPWNTNIFSTACTQAPNVYCDTIASFDDPNCFGDLCADAGPSPPHGWERGRSIVAWNEDAATFNTTTSFPFASNQDAFDSIYTSIFRVPTVLAMFGGGPARNRRSPFWGPQSGARSNFRELDGDVLSSPSVGPDGTIYIGTEGNKLYAINPNLTIKWTLNVGNDVKSTPLVFDDVVYFGCDDGKFRAVNADNGSTKYPAFDVGSVIRTSPAVADGIIYFGAGNDRVYAMNLNNTMIWNYKTGGDIDSSPALTPKIERADGRKTRTLIVGSDDNNLYALDADPDPALTAAQRFLWKRNLGADIESTPAIGDSDPRTVYVGSEDDHLYAVDVATGTVRWSRETDPDLDVDASAAIGLDGTVYYGGDDDRLTARNPDGSLAWSYETGGNIKSSPTLDASGLIYFGSDDGYVYALKATPASMTNAARLVFRVQTGGRAKVSSPMIGRDRSLYIGISDRDGLFAIRP